MTTETTEVKDTTKAPEPGAQAPVTNAPAPETQTEKPVKVDVLDNPLARVGDLLNTRNKRNEESQANKPKEKENVPSTEKVPSKQESASDNQSATKAPEAPAFNPLSWLKETHGIELASEDDLKTRLTSFDRLQADSNSKAEMETKLKELAEQVEQSKITDPYIAKLYELRKAGAGKEQIEAFNLANEIGDLSQLSSEDKVRMQLKLEDGYTDKQVDSWLRKNTIQKPESDDFDSTEDFEDAQSDYELFQAEFNKRSRDAEKYLKTFVAEAQNPVLEANVRTATELAETKAYDSSVEAIVPKLSQTFNNLQVELAENNVLDIDIDPGFKKLVPELLRDYYKNTRAELNEQGLQAGLDYLTTLAKAHQYEKDIKAMYAHGRSTREAEMRSEYDRNGSLTRSNSAPTNQTEDSFEQWKKKKLMG